MNFILYRCTVFIIFFSFHSVDRIPWPLPSINKLMRMPVAAVPTVAAMSAMATVSSVPSMSAVSSMPMRVSVPYAVFPEFDLWRDLFAAVEKSQAIL